MLACSYLFGYILQKNKSLQDEHTSSFIKVPNGFDPVNVQVRDQPAWVSLEGGKVPLLANYVPSAEDVLGRNVQFDIKCILLRDPKYFVSDQLHVRLPFW